MYIAIIGDIRDSKKIQDRFTVQKTLKSILEEINIIYQNDIAANFLITLGDEFQGILSLPNHIMEIIHYIKKHMYPVSIRFGIGFGDISTDINMDAAIGADGPAFYAARNAINFLHDSERKLKARSSDVKIEFYNMDDRFLLKESVNALLSLTKIIEYGWNENQRRTVWEMMDTGETQEVCAKKMNTTQPTIARRLSDANYLVYLDTLELIKKEMERLMEL
ncbi:SatD family protein [Oribacterium sp. WCC10]|uniref:SatD family protein n=1 Tax=Oribacterium sp. WCC10 TaxID=1855343 RepID=UPI0008E7A110|nr:SatD family protein [Oribacterium sp. WCC10]SFG30991.1 SatD family (SatD) [Oribacterium sp. WCC10]